MEIILLLVVLLIIAAIFFGIGFALRKRSRWLKIVVTSSIAVVVFLSIAYAGSGIGIGVYDFYIYGDKSCQDSSPSCANYIEKKGTFRANVPSLTLWMTIPKFLRPPCEPISLEFCSMEKSFDMAPCNYLAAAFAAVIVIFFMGQGMRQKDTQETLRSLVTCLTSLQR